MFIPTPTPPPPPRFVFQDPQLINKMGVVRTVSGNTCTVYLFDEKRDVSVNVKNITSVEPAKSDKVRTSGGGVRQWLCLAGWGVEGKWISIRDYCVAYKCTGLVNIWTPEKTWRVNWEHSSSPTSLLSRFSPMSSVSSCCCQFSPFTPEGDQCQISPAASPEILYTQ